MQITESYGFFQIPGNLRVLETTLITKETTHTFYFRKYFFVSF
jgi:hypothetical protein